MPTPAERLNMFGCNSQKAVHLHYMGIFTRLVNSCGDLPKQNESVPADAKVSFKFVNVHMCKQVCSIWKYVCELVCFHNSVVYV